ncbi:MAG: TRAP transporter small permease [Gammaproteobacteria bacterium]|nr:TRAP transporter small permease [Gammaproteobacteria bacterium]MDH3432624.1 TRAP transporter small permease [Gammaproteobacteria bacterium]
MKIRGAINRLEEAVLAFLLALMTVLTFVQVVLRYAFNSGIVWSLEATTYSFAALVLIGMSYGVRTKTHIAVDLLTRRMPSKVRRYVQLIAIAACIAYAVMMLYGSSVFVNRLYVLGSFARDVPAPKWLLTATMPLGFTLLGFRFLEVAWHLLRGDDDGVGGSAAAASTKLIDTHEEQPESPS